MDNWCPRTTEEIKSQKGCFQKGTLGRLQQLYNNYPPLLMPLYRRRFVETCLLNPNIANDKERPERYWVVTVNECLQQKR